MTRIFSIAGALLLSMLVMLAATELRFVNEVQAYGSGNGVPPLDVKQSCADAQKFSAGDDKKSVYSGCMQDEMNAKDQLAKRWSSFKPKDRQDCVEQARTPSPSYVEVLTCLEMDGDAMRNAPKIDGRPVPQIGGPVAPGLSSNPSPGTPSPAR